MKIHYIMCSFVLLGTIFCSGSEVDNKTASQEVMAGNVIVKETAQYVKTKDGKVYRSAEKQGEWQDEAGKIYYIVKDDSSSQCVVSLTDLDEAGFEFESSTSNSQ